MGKEPRRKKLILVILGGILIVLPVYAAVFDANLLPGSDNIYELGTAGGIVWKNLTVSGLLNLGQLANDPAIAQNGALYYNTNLNEVRGYQAGGWNSVTGQWINTSTGIYYAGAVGLNTQNSAVSSSLAVSDRVRLYTDAPSIKTYSGGQFNNLINFESSTSRLYLGGQWTNDYIFRSNGADVARLDSAGRLRIGNNPLPVYSLDVKSNGAQTALLGTSASDGIVVGGGSGKINAGTVDPVYSIAGEKYATYLPGMTGVVEEISGNIKISGSECEKAKICGLVIDFGDLEKGSDLWLFYQITDFGDNWEKLGVNLSSDFPGKIWYKKYPREKKLIFYAESGGEVSYRLSASRFDHADWPNINKDDVEGFKISEK